MQKRSPTCPSIVPLVERKQQLVRDAIWDAAIDLFDQKGFDETTVDDIAQAAGTSRRTFFRYFESKSDLMAQPIVSYGKTLHQAIESCPPGSSPVEIFRSAVVRVARNGAAFPRTRKVMAIAAKYPAAREAQMARMAEVHDSVAGAFAKRCGKSKKGVLQAQVLAGLTLSMLSVVYRSWFDQGHKDIASAAEEVFEALSELLCEGASK